MGDPSADIDVYSAARGVLLGTHSVGLVLLESNAHVFLVLQYLCMGGVMSM